MTGLACRVPVLSQQPNSATGPACRVSVYSSQPNVLTTAWDYLEALQLLLSDMIEKLSDQSLSHAVSENEDIGEADDEKYTETKRFVPLLTFSMLCLLVKLKVATSSHKVSVRYISTCE